MIPLGFGLKFLGMFLCATILFTLFTMASYHVLAAWISLPQITGDDMIDSALLFTVMKLAWTQHQLQQRTSQ